MKNKYRLVFSKEDRMRFIGHLDLLTLMQRIIKKSKLPIAYSEGFNPHQIMSFAMPLSLGMAGLKELLDIELTEEVDVSEIRDRLNANLPQGLKIIEVLEKHESDKNAASLLIAADYEVTLHKADGLEKAIEDFLSKEEIVVTKKSKKKLTQNDIRKDVFNLSGRENKITMKVAQGSNRNLRPELVVKYLLEQINISYEPHKTEYVRKELYLT